MMVILYFSLALLTSLALFFTIIPIMRPSSTLKLKSYGLLWACFFTLPIFAIILYYFLGSATLLKDYFTLKREAPAVEALAQLHSTQQMLERIKFHLHQQPNSAEGWFLLSRLYLNQYDNMKALKAAEKAATLAPKNLLYQINWAKVSFLCHHDQLTPELHVLLLQQLQQHPKQIDIINLLALDAYHKQNYQQAIQYWEKILPLVPVQSREGRTLLFMISQAQKKLANSNKE